MAKKGEDVAVGVPYYGYVGENPYQAGIIPPNAFIGDPKGIPIQQTIYRDTPAPFNCVYCSHSGQTTIRSKPSLAAFVGCMMPMMLGVCFLFPSMDCLWHKYHYCPHCHEKVADYEKTDPCIVVDPPNWTQQSFALSAQ
ncbi:GSH-induced LITAF domain protein [Senna tora]|uniref:GSH-induced LITAF domain protein n=1 Tax=Senna tora TaxID=362788 RepID=A0A835CF13_9FABA|nr:GSH-induced LITAF domain protein [Senna tora]